MNSRSLWMQASQPDDALRVLPTPRPRYVRFGAFELDLQRQELFRAGLRVPVSHKVLEVLLILIEKPGEVVTRETLRNRLWPADFHVNYNANVNTNVNKLRLILGDSTDQPTFVATIPRRGYAFVARTEYSNQPCHAVTRPLAVSSELSQPLYESGKFKFQVTWFIAKVGGLLLAGITIGATVGYLAFHR
jgi:DNA-binding winged helix-turn-helix (wHTH) protein